MWHLISTDLMSRISISLAYSYGLSTTCIPEFTIAVDNQLQARECRYGKIHSVLAFIWPTVGDFERYCRDLPVVCHGELFAYR